MSCQSCASQGCIAFHFLLPKLIFCIKYAIFCVNENPAIDTASLKHFPTLHNTVKHVHWALSYPQEENRIKIICLLRMRLSMYCLTDSIQVPTKSTLNKLTCSYNFHKVSVVYLPFLPWVIAILWHQHSVFLWAQHNSKQLIQTSIKLWFYTKEVIKF